MKKLKEVREAAAEGPLNPTSTLREIAWVMMNNCPQWKQKSYQKERDLNGNRRNLVSFLEKKKKEFKMPDSISNGRGLLFLRGIIK